MRCSSATRGLPILYQTPVGHVCRLLISTNDHSTVKTGALNRAEREELTAVLLLLGVADAGVGDILDQLELE
jgi:hypothetical protein